MSLEIHSQSCFHRGISKYVLRLLCMMLAAICMCACGSHKSVRLSKTSRGRGKQQVEAVIPHNLSGERLAVVKEAAEWVGTPYRYAAQEKGEGTDCSGMVMSVYDKVLDIKLPRNSAKQAEFCKVLREKDVRPGDLVFFATGKDPDRISHVGIMLNDDDFVHASTSKGVVISKVSSPYYQRTFMMYGRAIR